MKSLTFLWYSFWYTVTNELPLSTLDILALLLTNFSLIWFMVFFPRFLCLLRYMCVSLLVYIDVLCYMVLGSVYGLVHVLVIGLWPSQLLGPRDEKREQNIFGKPEIKELRGTKSWLWCLQLITCYNCKWLNIYIFYNFKKLICSSISKLTIFSAHFCPPTYSTPKNFRQFYIQETSILSRLLMWFILLPDDGPVRVETCRS